MQATQFESCIAVTGPAALWQASSDQIVRTIDPRYCDLKFRNALGNLTGRQYARMVRIASDGWSGVQYAVEYDPGSSWELLATHFQRLHWRLRLQVVSDICEAAALWQHGPIHPLSLNLYNIVMIKDAGHWFPWLLPCPPLEYGYPCDLFGANLAVISAIAPEVIRGISFRHRAQDMYALGTLALHALGITENADAVSDEERIEAQVCGALLPGDLAASEVELFLQEVPALHDLMRVIHQYTYISPDVRPVDEEALAEACARAVATTDPVLLAKEAVSTGYSKEANEILEWGFRYFESSRAGRILAVDICEQLGDYPKALQHLEVAITLDGGWDLDDLLRRVDLRWNYLRSLPVPDPNTPDSEGDLLLQDLDLLKQIPAGMLSSRNYPWLLTGHVLRRRGDVLGAIPEYHEAASREQADLNALWLYGEALRDAGYAVEAAQVVAEANSRIGKMYTSQMMGSNEVQVWQQQFAALL